MTIAGLVLFVVGAYGLLGLAFSIAFTLRGAARIDPAAVHSGWGFRIVILPGSMLMWPWLLVKWIGALRAAP